MKKLAIFSVFAVLLLFGCVSPPPLRGLNASAQLPQPGVYVLRAPQYAVMGNEPALFYEIFLANRSADGLYKVEVRSNGRVLKTMEGEELNQSLRGPQLGVNDYAVYMWVPLADKPASISHKLYFKGGETVEGADTEINYATPIAISPPVYGSGWLSAEGPYNFNHHRRAIIPLMGKTYVPERFAIDWIRYGPNGRIYKTDGSTVEDYWGYGQEIHAVADGIVVDTKDGIQNNVPFNIPPMSVGQAAGNLVTEQIGNNTYAYYVHLIPGSLRVKIGDRVKTGDVLGSLGSTGISGAPHLHFHIGDTKDPLFTDGLPYVFKSYEWDGNGDWEGQFNSSWNGSFASPIIVNNSMPGYENVVTVGPEKNSSLVFVTAYEGGAKYRTREGKFIVLDLHGSFREMGRQYGYLMHDEMQEVYNRTMDGTAAMGMSKADLDENAEMFYQSMPERYVELMGGMSETSGLTLQEQKELNGGMVSLINAYLVNTTNAAGSNASKGCSGVAFWGNYSKDGKLYFGRYWDMINSLQVPYLPYLTVAIYHPDSGNTVANLQWVGEVYTETAMNDKGIFLELNNGQHSDPAHFANRQYAGVELLDFMFDSSTMEDIDREFHTTMDSDSYIIQVANKDVAYSYEWPTFGVSRRSENVSGLLVAYNDFVPPYPVEWEGKILPPNPRDLRRSNFLAMANSPEYKGKMDEKLMQQFLAVPFKDGGGMIPNNVYQVIAVPEEYKMWLHGQNYSGWEEIDLAPLFFPN
ncbi:Peptidase family M23 [uncultured archaeon]|nr:Peptidase family M23 [uncultured archaeon]